MIRAGTLVLGYHRVAEPTGDPHRLCVAPERFEAQLAELRRRAEIVPLAAVLAQGARAGPTRRRGSRPRVALTFDDGYRDNLTAAYPALNRAGAPATFFITTGMVGANREFWWDRLERLCFGAGRAPVHLDLEVAGARLWVDARTPAGRERAHWALHRRLLAAPPEAVESVLDAVAEQLGGDPGPRGDRFPLDEDELRRLAAADGVEIGAHSVTHPRLAGLPAERQREEVAGSREALEARLGCPVRAFAYPFGGPDAVDEATVACVRAAGFALACTTLEGRVRAATDPLRVPRCTVRDWDGAELARRLDAWLRA